MKYYPKDIPILSGFGKIKERKEAKKTLTSLDRAVLARVRERSDTGEDIMGLLSSVRPYVDSDSAKRFSTLQLVDKSVRKLISKGFVYSK